MTCEVVSVSRWDLKDQKTVAWFDDPADMERRRREEPLRYFFLFAHWSKHTRIATYHTM